MKPVIFSSASFNHFMWNLDASVGKGGANSNTVDILYVQFYYYTAARHPLTTTRKELYLEVELSGRCTGRDDDPLVAAILAHQKGINHPYVDGRVSVAKGNGKLGDMAFFVYRLGARLADMYPKLWPRLDLYKECPAPLAEKVRSAIPTLPKE